jgi:hypothetical protein
MKYTLAALAAVCSIASLTFAPPAMAGRTPRIDAGYPCLQTWTQTSTLPAEAADFTPAGSAGQAVFGCAPNPSDDMFETGGGPIFNGLYNATFTGTNNDVNLATSGLMLQFHNPNFPNSENDIGSQVVIWNLGANNILGGTGDVEIELNSWCIGDTSAAAAGVFMWGGNTYKGGCGSTSPNDFLFSSSGKLLGYINDGTDGSLTRSGTVPSGWTVTSGSTSAPEIDPTSAVAAFTLLVGGLVVLRGGRRMRHTS